ncbi:MAG: Gfo/Idh/MocA family oxidoreductase [Chloroflexi bacterium]|nr:Gfo/Idh/MocA family oxidoreductase [Chloroflexota bacterium]MCY3581932.1 Gfo/Idh/MocA family oxidoreductase [Chloroflexota bacterium]MCY3716429.1 Gfo/Idh/MocA family oxidoreductase [Chloroflexota bacterium]MDE2650931.1 Gfo/Idh/MocA family oxidoreductase [Chloroflexota bacterium]MXX51225.1 Gfo/Idh/MocA family oxidoreductase [Chloroflexota bacterium]
MTTVPEHDAPIRLAVISFAHAHVRLYCQVIADYPDAQVIACWDDDAARGQQFAQQFGLDWLPRLDVLLAREDIDAVFIASPTNQHAEHAVAAAKAGKHILLQKPMALTLADCDAIIAAINEAGVKFSLCYQMRCDPVNLEMKKLVDAGAVGDIAVLRRRHAIPLLLDKNWAAPGNWHIDPVQNMGMFMDDASHAADWFYWMLGKPVSVMAEIDNVITQAAPDDNGVALFRFRKGEIGILFNSSTQLAAEATTEIYGSAGSIHQNYGDAPSSLLPADGSALKVFRAGASDWQRYDFPLVPQRARIQAVPRPLIDYLKGKAPPIATAAEGKVCIEMILGAYQSAREGRRVYF